MKRKILSHIITYTTIFATAFFPWSCSEIFIDHPCPEVANILNSCNKGYFVAKVVFPDGSVVEETEPGITFPGPGVNYPIHPGIERGSDGKCHLTFNGLDLGKLESYAAAGGNSQFVVEDSRGNKLTYKCQ